ncbi:MAG: DNA mismatch repair protein MutS, partial [Deltaproteobacteria bacterium]
KEGVRNFNIAVREWGEKIIFLRKIMEGGTNRSYGIQVARLAGVPAEVITRAKEILRNLEKGELDEAGMPKIARGRKANRKNANQLSLWGHPAAECPQDVVLEEIRSLDPMNLTPLDALRHLSDWKQRLESL